MFVNIPIAVTAVATKVAIAEQAFLSNRDCSYMGSSRGVNTLDFMLCVRCTALNIFFLLLGACIWFSFVVEVSRYEMDGT